MSEENELRSSARDGDFEAVKRLVKKGVDVNTENRVGQRPLHMAAVGGQVEILDFLLQNGATINAQTRAGESPLHFASKGGSQSVVELLLKKGAEANLQNNAGQTPLHLASIEGQEAAIKVLCQYGASKDVSDESGKTPVSVSKDDSIKSVIEQSAKGAPLTPMKTDAPPSTPQNTNESNHKRTPSLQSNPSLQSTPSRRGIADEIPPEQTPLGRRQSLRTIRGSLPVSEAPITPATPVPETPTKTPSTDFRNTSQVSTPATISTPTTHMTPMSHHLTPISHVTPTSSSDGINAVLLSVLQQQVNEISHLRSELQSMREKVDVMMHSAIPQILYMKYNDKIAVFRFDSLIAGDLQINEPSN